jgi:hypothetical protein
MWDWFMTARNVEWQNITQKFVDKFIRSIQALRNIEEIKNRIAG